MFFGVYEILTTAYYAIKISSIVIVSTAFLLGINALIGLLGSWVSSTFIGEFFSMVSMYLPFNAGTVFNGILTVCIGIFTFKVAKKIYDLSTWSIQSA